MDRDDREHFRMIQNPSAEQSRDRQGHSQSHPGLDWFQTKAKAICGCYRRDEAQDPETFAAALAAVLSDYPAAIVEYAADPRTGVIKAFPMGLPSVGQVGQFLDEMQARQERINRYASLPKQRRVVRDRPAMAEPNLFVPDTAHRYAAMLKMHEKDHDGRSRKGSKTCADGILRHGLFVPVNWYEDGTALGDDTLASASRKIFEKFCADAGYPTDSQVSPALMANIMEHEANDADA